MMMWRSVTRLIKRSSTCSWTRVKMSRRAMVQKQLLNLRRVEEKEYTQMKIFHLYQIKVQIVILKLNFLWMIFLNCHQSNLVIKSLPMIDDYKMETYPRLTMFKIINLKLFCKVWDVWKALSRNIFLSFHSSNSKRAEYITKPTRITNTSFASQTFLKKYFMTPQKQKENS